MTGADDLVIRVHLDTVQAKQEIQKQDQAARNLGASVGAGMLNAGLKGVAGALGLIFGPSAAQSMSNTREVAGNVGRSTFLGQQIERDSAELDAKRRARSATAEMFGMAGRVSSKEQILAIYNALLQFEMREAKGRQRVEGFIDQKNAKETLDALNFAVSNLGAVFKELVNLFRGGGRPEIK